MSDAEVFGTAGADPTITPQPPVMPVQSQPLPGIAGSNSYGQPLTPGAELSDADVFGVAPNGQPGATTTHPDFMLGLYQGAMKPLDNAARGLEWLAGKAGLPVDQIDTGLGMPSAQQATDAHRAYVTSQAPLGKRPGAVGNFLGEMAGSTPFVVGMGPMAGGAATSALLTNANTPGGIATDAALGAAGGKVADWAVRGVQGAIAPQIGDQLRTLMGDKIPLTPGQMANGTLRRLEDGATSIPILGDIINSAKGRSIVGLNRAVGNRALGAVGEQLPPEIGVGRPMVAYVGDRLSQRYSDLLPGLTITADEPFAKDVADIAKNSKLLPDHKQMLGDFVNDNIRPYVSADGTMSGQAMKDVDETIRSEIKDWKNSPLPADRKYAGALDDLRGALRDLVARNNPEKAQELQNLNRGWAHLAILEDAASRQGAVEGVFTPGQLEGAVRKANDTVRKRGFARGEALMQDLSDAAKARLPSTVPDSGSPLRHAIEAGVGLGVAKESGLLKPLIKGAVVGGTVGLPYTRVGQAALNSVASIPRGPMMEEIARALGYTRQPLVSAAGAGVPMLAAPIVQQTP